MFHAYAPMALACGIGGWLLFLSLFAWCVPLQRKAKRLLPEKWHWILNWLFLLWLLLALLSSISAIILGNKGYTQLNDTSIISETFLIVAGFAIGYGFWALDSKCSGKWRVALWSLLPLFAVCSIFAIVLGYLSAGTFMAVAGLVLGYASLPVLFVGIVFAILPWSN